MLVSLLPLLVDHLTAKSIVVATYAAGMSSLFVNIDVNFDVNVGVNVSNNML